MESKKAMVQYKKGEFRDNRIGTIISSLISAYFKAEDWLAKKKCLKDITINVEVTERGKGESK